MIFCISCSRCQKHFCRDCLPGLSIIFKILIPFQDVNFCLPREKPELSAASAQKTHHLIQKTESYKTGSESGNKESLNQQVPEPIGLY